MTVLTVYTPARLNGSALENCFESAGSAAVKSGCKKCGSPPQRHLFLVVCVVVHAASRSALVDTLFTKEEFRQGEAVYDCRNPHNAGSWGQSSVS